MEFKKPLILDIKGNSLDDGPGIRTTIFFKGCPLSCVWCHNPECKDAGYELAWDRKECIGCNSCINVCEPAALSRDNPDFVDRRKCTLCFKCAEVCPANAMTKAGHDMGIEEVIEMMRKDVPFFLTSGGGVTLSGGEPTLFMRFAADLLRKLKSVNIQTLIETCGQFDCAAFFELLYPYLDFIYYDIKLMDSQEHRKYCGVSNERILDNFRELYHASQRKGGVEVLPRIALIPGITDRRHNLEAAASFLTENKAREVALLQYNPLWVEKSKKLGVYSSYTEDVKMTTWMSLSHLKECSSIFQTRGIVTR
jgi:pyruvate formate lyase activating enzyme